MIIFVSCNHGSNRDETASDTIIKKINGDTVIPRDANRIFVPFFHDLTGNPIVSDRLTLRVRELLSMDGRLSLVSSSSEADLKLIGKIIQYQTQAIQFSAHGEPIRKRLRIVASIDMFNINKNKDILSKRWVQSFEVYSEMIPPISSEMQAQERVIDSLARRIIVLIINGWYTDLMTPVEKGKQ